LTAKHTKHLARVFRGCPLNFLKAWPAADGIRFSTTRSPVAKPAFLAPFFAVVDVLNLEGKFLQVVSQLVRFVTELPKRLLVFPRVANEK